MEICVGTRSLQEYPKALGVRTLFGNLDSSKQILQLSSKKKQKKRRAVHKKVLWNKTLLLQRVAIASRVHFSFPILPYLLPLWRWNVRRWIVGSSTLFMYYSLNAHEKQIFIAKRDPKRSWVGLRREDDWVRGAVKVARYGCSVRGAT